MLACDSAVRELVTRGLVACSGVPILRWNAGASLETGGGVSATYGAFTRHALRFDVSTFGISPAESRQMDALMAMALEGGYAASRQHRSGRGDGRNVVAESHVGVFVGAGGLVGCGDMEERREAPGDARSVSVYTGTSRALSILSGRLSYVLGLTGPCLSLDTACSSSLVAAHVALGFIGLQECSRALALGAGVLSQPSTTAFSAAGMLSALGRCHTFDRKADGYCRGEGCCAYVIETLAEPGAGTPSAMF